VESGAVHTFQELLGGETAAEEERRTSYLELFFDLVFVFAITQVTALILHDLSAGGIARGALILGLVWWAWGGYAWMTNAIDTDPAGIRVLFLGCTLASFFVSLAVPDAFGADGLWFAIPYLVLRSLHIALYVWGLRGDHEHQRAIARLAPFFLVAPLVVLAGAFVENENLRTAIWVAALAIDMGGALTASGFRVSASHFAERYALFVIIALGESIVAIGVGAGALEHDFTFAATVTIAFAGVAALWWAYFDIVALAGERSLRLADEIRRPRLARDVFSYFHYPAILGIILYAVAAEKAVAHPEDPLSTPARAALGLGVALFLLSAILGRWRVLRRINWERTIGAIVVLAVALAASGIEAMWLVALVVAILIGVVTVEAVRLKEFRASLHAH
jgi:low temperature requirement protein LtrA